MHLRPYYTVYVLSHSVKYRGKITFGRQVALLEMNLCLQSFTLFCKIAITAHQVNSHQKSQRQYLADCVRKQQTLHRARII